MTGRTLRDSRTARGENVTRDYGGTTRAAGESERRRRTRRTEGREKQGGIYTHHRCSAFSIGSSAWNPSCPSLAVARTTTTTTVATSSSSSSTSFCALRLVLRRDDLPRSIVGFFFLPFRTLTTLRVPRSSSRDRFSRARFAHYLVGSIARIAVARSLARSSIAEGEAGKGGRGRVKKASRSYTDYHSLARSFVRSFVRTGSSFATCKNAIRRRGTLSRKRQVSLVTRTILICNPRRSNGDRTLRTPPHPTSPLPMMLHHPPRRRSSSLPLAPTRRAPSYSVDDRRRVEPIDCSSRPRFAAPGARRERDGRTRAADAPRATGGSERGVGRVAERVQMRAS